MPLLLSSCLSFSISLSRPSPLIHPFLSPFLPTIYPFPRLVILVHLADICRRGIVNWESSSSESILKWIIDINIIYERDLSFMRRMIVILSVVLS